MERGAREFMFLLLIVAIVGFGIWRTSISWQIYFEHFPNDPWYYYFLK